RRARALAARGAHADRTVGAGDGICAGRHRRRRHRRLRAVHRPAHPRAAPAADRHGATCYEPEHTTMTDLIFGVGVPASAALDDDPVGLAQEAERLGFDFVSAADHPCGSGPSYATTAMLTWIAARTSRIKVASRVLGVPFRRPAMVAKLAVSLDLLSGGRFILGLGAGYSDQAIAPVGGPALSPAATLDALPEALQVTRGHWPRSGYTQHGCPHGARALTTEPRPAHPIPVWLAPFGPRALAAPGALAAGWIPPLGSQPIEEFPAMRRRID